ncbi:MAG: Sec-independent protein translocase protein TatB [Chromatiaceae bacterium]
MFDIGFMELVVVAVVALLVVGPERLPRLARTAGLWVGRARRTLATVKAEIDSELKAEELKEILAKQARANPLETIIETSLGQPAATKPPSPPDQPAPFKPESPN